MPIEPSILMTTFLCKYESCSLANRSYFFRSMIGSDELLSPTIKVDWGERAFTRVTMLKFPHSVGTALGISCVNCRNEL